jgi:hypothetical protein
MRAERVKLEDVPGRNDVVKCGYKAAARKVVQKISLLTKLKSIN